MKFARRVFVLLAVLLAACSSPAPALDPTPTLVPAATDLPPTLPLLPPASVVPAPGVTVVPTLALSWQRVAITTGNISVETPKDWKRAGSEWMWIRPNAAPPSAGTPSPGPATARAQNAGTPSPGTPGTGAQSISIHWDARKGGWEPTAMLPNHSVSLDAQPIELSWGKGMLHTVQVSAPGAQGGQPVAVQIHAIILTEKLAYDFSASAQTPEELASLQPVIEHMLYSVKLLN